MKKPWGRQPRGRILTWIAVFKFAKTLLFIGVALAAFEMLRPGVSARVQSWVADLPFALEQRMAENTLTRLFRLGSGGKVAVGIGALLYAGLFLTEGIGLLRQKRWAEWLTVIATASLVPFEVYECFMRITPVRIGALVINLAILAYLVVQLRKK